MTPTQQIPEMMVGALSETGKVREENQDRMTRTQVPLGDLYIVADGMGGYQGGAQAAQLTIQAVEDYLRSIPAGSPPEEAITHAIEAANTRVYAEANSGNPDTEKMGSTIVLLLVTGGQAHIAHVGDSRAYIVRQGQLRLLTHDHTAVQRMIDAQMLTEEEAEDHPDSSLLSRAIGPKPTVEPEILPSMALEPGDIILLCSDGLTRYVKEAQIAEIATGKGSEQDIAKRLVDLALDAGGHDNVSVQFARFAVRTNPPRARWTIGTIPRQVKMTALACFAVAVTVAAIAGVNSRRNALISQKFINRNAQQQPATLASEAPGAPIGAPNPAAVPPVSVSTAPSVVPGGTDQGKMRGLEREINTLQQKFDAERKRTALLQAEFGAEAKKAALLEKNLLEEKERSVSLQKSFEDEKKQLAALKQQQSSAQPVDAAALPSPGQVEKKKDQAPQPAPTSQTPPPESPKANQ